MKPSARIIAIVLAGLFILSALFGIFYQLASSL